MRFASYQSARERLPVSSHGLSKASLWSGSWCSRRSRDRPLRSRYGRSRNSPRRTNGSEDRRSGIPAAMESILTAYWKTSSCDAITWRLCRRSHRVAPRANWDGYHSMSWEKMGMHTTLLIAGAFSSAVAIAVATT